MPGDKEDEEPEYQEVFYYSRKGGRSKAKESSPMEPVRSSLAVAQKSVAQAKKTWQEDTKKNKESLRKEEKSQANPEQRTKAKQDPHLQKSLNSRMKGAQEQQQLESQGRAFVREQIARGKGKDADQAPLAGSKRTSEEMRDNLKDFNSVLKRFKKMSKETASQQTPLPPILEETSQAVPQTPPRVDLEDESSSQKQTSEQESKLVDDSLTTPPSSKADTTMKDVQDKEEG